MYNRLRHSIKNMLILGGFLLILGSMGNLNAAEGLDSFNQTLMQQAQKALAVGDDAKAEELLSKILKTYPDNQDILHTTAQVYFRQAKYREAAALDSRILRLNPNDGQALMQLGISRWRLKEGYEGQAALLKALSLNSLSAEQQTQARQTLNEIYDDWAVLKVMQQRNDYAAQERFHTHQIEKNSEGTAVSYALRGFARHWLQKTGDAKADFEKALSLGGLDEDLKTGVEKSLSEIDKAEQARLQAEKEQRLAAEHEQNSITFKPEPQPTVQAPPVPLVPPRPVAPPINVYQSFDQMDKLLANGEVSKAEAVFKRIGNLKLKGEEKGILLYYEAELAWLRGAYQQATPKYEQATALISERFRLAATLMRLAQYEAMQGNNNAAEGYVAQSADLLADQPWKQKQVAGFFMSLGDHAKAIGYYQQALRLDSTPQNNTDTFMGLAEIYKLDNDETGYHLYAQKYLQAATPHLNQLTVVEQGMFYFYRAELQADQVAAYADYEQAAKRIIEKYRLSEIYIKMAQYQAEDGNDSLAAYYAVLSAQTLPDQFWRNRQVAAVFEQTGQLDEAIQYTQAAMALEPDNLRADRDLAFLYLRNHDQDNYINSHNAYIDKLIDEIQRQGARAERELKVELYEARQYRTDTSRVWGFDSYNFGNRRSNGDYSIMTVNELFLNYLLPTDTPGKVYHRINGTFSSHYSGSYMDPFTSVERNWQSNNSLKNSAHGIIGSKVNPISALPDFGLGVEYLYPIGRDIADDFRGRLEYNRTWGEKPRPFDGFHWTYAKTYAELIYSTRHNDFTAFSELSYGRTFSLDFYKNFLTMPHIRVNWSYGGEEMEKGGRWGLEVGPALAFRLWFNEDRYHAPRSYLEVGIQYYFGLSHELDNGIAFNLTFSF